MPKSSGVNETIKLMDVVKTKNS